MTVTVIAIVEPQTSPAPLARVMEERLNRLAKELEQEHLRELQTVEPLYEDVVVYISYTSKYTVRWQIVNDVPKVVEQFVSERCALLGYVTWKFSAYAINNKGKLDG